MQFVALRLFCDIVVARNFTRAAQWNDRTQAHASNVVRALEEAKRKGVQSIAFLGRDGGFTRGLATIDLIVPGTATARIQEGQKVLYHALCEIVEEQLPKV